MPKPIHHGNFKGNNQFPKYQDLTGEFLNFEFHIHTDWTDGKCSPTEVFNTARERQLKRLAFTEHVRRATDWFQDFFLYIDNLRKGYTDLDVFIGCETKALDDRGMLDVAQVVMDRCEIVLGSVHRIPSKIDGFVDPKKMSSKEFADMELSYAIGMIRNSSIDVIAHPMGMYLKQYVGYPTDHIESLIVESVEAGVAVEINSSYLGCYLPDFLKQCEILNPHVSIGSDVHSCDDLGRCRDMILRGWNK